MFLTLSLVFASVWSHLDDDDDNKEMFEQLFNNIQCHLQANEDQPVLLHVKTNDQISRHAITSIYKQTKKASKCTKEVFFYHIDEHLIWEIIFSNPCVSANLSNVVLLRLTEMYTFSQVFLSFSFWILIRQKEKNSFEKYVHLLIFSVMTIILIEGLYVNWMSIFFSEKTFQLVLVSKYRRHVSIMEN